MEGIVKACSITGSKLAEFDALAHIALPIGPGSYFPPRALITELLTDVRVLQTVSDRDEKISRAMYKLRDWKSAHTFSCPNSPEDAFTRPNIEILFRLIYQFIGSPKFVIGSHISATCKIPFFFCQR